MNQERKNIDVFDRDAAENGGYLYTDTDQLSCRLATQRSTELILSAGCFTGRSLIDLGCGDGFYTVRWWDLAQPKSITGVDPAVNAIAAAEQRKGDRPIKFEVGDAHDLPYPDGSFDVALIQSILHHDDDPADIIREAFRVAPTILIHEPNGNSLGLKVIEKLSPYHRAHNEKSYRSSEIAHWIKEAGGRLVHQAYAGFVPMFAPDWLARSMKFAEPAIESLPLVASMACAVFVTVATHPACVGVPTAPLPPSVNS